MTKSLANVRIYGDDAGAVSVAPKGSTLPTNLSALSAPIVEVGWISEDGVSISQENDAETFTAWQGGTVVRKRITSTEHSFTFQALEETALVLGLFYAGSTSATATGVTTVSVSGGSNTDERAWVLDFHDGTVHKRYVIPRGEVTERGEIAHQSSEMTVYEFTVTIYGDFDIITNNPAVATA